jgi:hypothetical protein
MAMTQIYSEKGLYRLRGQGTSGDVERVSLFDGRFDTGFVLRSITVVPQSILSSEEISLRVLLEEEAHAVNWDWSSPNEIAWASYGTPINTRFGLYDRIDPDVIIVEDMYLDFSGDADQIINYMIELEKIKMDSWEGGFQIAKNRNS